jgi:DNA-directed RNA polymerase specialized sigma24 family protein
VNTLHTRERSEARESSREDVLFFRAQTIAIVRHFYEIASQIGRLPSILGREFFRAKVSHHTIPSFEEQAVFVHDVEHALGKLDEKAAEVVALVGLFQYSLDDVAMMLKVSRSRVAQRYAESIDQLAERFLETGLLREDRPDRQIRHFQMDESRPRLRPLPPKKQPASVKPAEYYEISGEGASYTFAGGGYKS